MVSTARKPSSRNVKVTVMPAKSCRTLFLSCPVRAGWRTDAAVEPSRGRCTSWHALHGRASNGHRRGRRMTRHATVPPGGRPPGHGGLPALRWLRCGHRGRCRKPGRPETADRDCTDTPAGCSPPSRGDSRPGSCSSSPAGRGSGREPVGRNPPCPSWLPLAAIRSSITYCLVAT